MNVLKIIYLFGLLIFLSCERSADDDQAQLPDSHNPEDCDFQTSTPPFSGTIFIDPDIITPNDPTTFTGLSYV